MPVERGRSLETTDREIDYAAANGHLMRYYEDAEESGKVGRAAAWAAWHSENCPCQGTEPVPDW